MGSEEAGWVFVGGGAPRADFWLSPLLSTPPLQVLLKNDVAVLPLTLDGADGRTLAVLGSAAAGVGLVTGGGGSGAVVPKHAVSLLEGIYLRFGLNSSAWSAGGDGNCTFLEGVDYYQVHVPFRVLLLLLLLLCSFNASTLIFLTP